MWQYIPAMEAYYPREVVRDPRYQAVLERIGVGRTWRAHIRNKATELTPVTSICVTTPPPPEDISTTRS